MATHSFHCIRIYIYIGYCAGLPHFDKKKNRLMTIFQTGNTFFRCVFARFETISIFAQYYIYFFPLSLPKMARARTKRF